MTRYGGALFPRDVTMAAAEAALEIPPPQSEARVPNHGGGSASLCCYSCVQQSNQCKSRSRPPGFTADENICLVPHAVAAPIVRVVGGEASDTQLSTYHRGELPMNRSSEFFRAVAALGVLLVVPAATFA